MWSISFILSLCWMRKDADWQEENGSKDGKPVPFEILNLKYGKCFPAYRSRESRRMPCFTNNATGQPLECRFKIYKHFWKREYSWDVGRSPDVHNWKTTMKGSWGNLTDPNPSPSLSTYTRARPQLTYDLWEPYCKHLVYGAQPMY